MARDLRSTAAAFMLLFGAVFGCGALLSGWLAAEELLIVTELQSRGVAVEGEVYDYARKRPSGTGRRGMGPDYFAPLVRFRTLEGKAVTIEGNAGLQAQYPLGPYPVRYLPGKPQQARIDDFTSMWLWSTILAACTLLMLLVTTLTLRGASRLR